MSSPLVSVITTVYNCDKFLEESLESIFNQTFKDYEIIIYDDASTDNTHDIIFNYLRKFKYIHVILDPKNVGCGEGRNRAIAKASGKYLAIEDGDDISLLERLEKQVEFMESNQDISFLGGHALQIDENSDLIEDIFNYPPKYNKDILTMASIKNANPMIDPTMILRKEAFEELGGYSLKEDRKLVPDFDLWLRAMVKGYKFHNLQIPLVKYRINSEGNTIKFKKEMIRQHMVVLSEFKKIYKKLDY